MKKAQSYNRLGLVIYVCEKIKNSLKQWFVLDCLWYATNVVKRTKTVAVKDVLCKNVMLNGKFYNKTYYVFNIVLFCSF